MADKCDLDNCEDETCGVRGTLVDFVTGEKVADTLVERIIQRTERFLVEDRNYSKSDIEVGKEFVVAVDSETVKPRADIIVRAGGKRAIIIKCIYGALMAGERLVLSYARLLDSYQIPFAVVTNGDDADVIDTISGNVIGSGLQAIPSKDDLNIDEIEFTEFPEDKIAGEKRILNAFESIDEATCPNIGG